MAKPDPEADAPVPPAPVGARAPQPTMDDVARLTPLSDFSPFTAPGVDPLVRNAALRKLFHSDPHFGRSDGLNVSDDEVMELGSSPQARQRKIMQARALGLLDDELLDQPADDTDLPQGPSGPA